MRKTKFKVRHVSFDDESGTTVYSDPAEEYIGSVFQSSNSRSIQIYGERIENILSCILRNIVCDKIDNGDLVYIYTDTEGEKSIGDNADYIVLSKMSSNQFTELQFEKIQKEI